MKRQEFRLEGCCTAQHSHQNIFQLVWIKRMNVLKVFKANVRGICWLANGAEAPENIQYHTAVYQNTPALASFLYLASLFLFQFSFFSLFLVHAYLNILVTAYNWYFPSLQHSIVTSSATLKMQGQAHCRPKGNFLPTTKLHLDTKTSMHAQMHEPEHAHMHVSINTQTLTRTDGCSHEACKFHYTTKLSFEKKKDLG